MTTAWRPLLMAAVLSALPNDMAAQAGNGFYGKYIGKLKSYHHGVSGDVFAVDSRTLHIRDFTYDGEGPAAYFYVGTSKAPGPDGIRIPDEKGSNQPLSPSPGKHITLTLPETGTLNTIKWFSVWCEEYSVNFGDVRIPKSLDYPKPLKMEGLNGVHAVSSDSIVIVDAQTLLIPNFSYDGEAPDAKFWVGRGAKPSPQGVRVPDENGKEEPLRRYDRKTIVLTLPGDLTVFDIGHFGVWCEAFAVDFGHVRLPARLNVPPSLRMLGVSPQSKLNCEVLYDDLAFEVRWAVAGDSIVMQLVSKLGAGEYMSFGISGDDSKSQMIGGDVVVAWVEQDTLKGHADDYFLEDKSQCTGVSGSCPDERLRAGTNSAQPLNAAVVNGYSIVTYQRPLAAQDELDRTVLTNGSQAVIWAIGPLNSRQEVSYHDTLATKGDLFFDFGRPPKWNCPLPETEPSHKTLTKTHGSSTTRYTQQEEYFPADDVDTTNYRQASSLSTGNPRGTTRPVATPAPAPTNNAWDIPAIQCYEPEDGVFYAQMGPTGGKRGYPAITGHVGWGIAWYINGLLIPEINVVRGKTYTFVVEGGLNPDLPARYHPFYITDDPVGGYEHKTPEERAEVQVFAGVKQTRRGPIPTGTGRLCNWTPDPKHPPADEFASFGAYQRTLTLECDEGEPGVVQWTPDHNTPDVVYYQCFTHRYLGWKINVLDSCDYSEAASELISSHVPPEDDLDVEDEDGELQSRPSIRVTTRVKPNGIFSYTKDQASTPKNLDDSYVKEFSQQSTMSHSDKPQNFYISKSTKPGKSDSDTGDEQHDSHITDPFIPPPVQQKEPERSPHNSSAPTYHLPQVTEPNQEGSDLKQTADLSKYKTETITSQSQRMSPTPAQYSQLNHSLSTIDPMRKPIVHATTPYSVLPTSNSKLHPENPTEQKLDADKIQLAEESQQSEVTVNSNGISPRNETKDIKPLKSTVSESTPAFNNLAGSPHSTHVSTPPHNFGITRLPSPISMHPQMPFQRPAHLYNVPPFRRPVPPLGYPRHRPSAPMHRPHYALPNAAGFKINPKKPFYRVPAVMASSHHPVMVTPSFTHRPLMPNMHPHSPFQHHLSTIKYFPYSLPNTHNLNAQKMPPVPVSTTEPIPISLKSISLVPLPNIADNKAAATSATSENKTSDLMASTLTEKVKADIKPLPADIKPLPAAINTGFHPESVIVEGGFKPIVTKKVIAEDRLSLIEKEDEADEKSEGTEESRIQEERKKNPFEGQQPETFEPMFIPSPPDRIIGQQNASEKLTKKPVTLVEDLVPPSPGIDHRHGPHPIRKASHPQLIMQKFDGVRRPLHAHKVIAHYHLPARSSSPSFRYQQNSQQDDETAMAAERMDIYYLPPDEFTTNERHQSPPSVDGDLPPGAVVTYDGKPVIDSSLASSIPDRSVVSSQRQPTGAAALLQGTPQFGPYRGEVPPPVPDDIRPESIPQLQNQRPSNLNPVDFDESRLTYGQSTRLTSVAKLEENEETADILSAEATEIKEVQITPENQPKTIILPTKQAPLKKDTSTHDSSSTVVTDIQTNSQVLSNSTSEATTLQDESPRIRRSATPHHTPDHNAEHDHIHEHSDHDHHYHEHHDHPITSDLQNDNYKLMTAPSHPSNGALRNYSIPSVIIMALITSAVLKFLEGITQ